MEDHIILERFEIISNQIERFIKIQEECIELQKETNKWLHNIVIAITIFKGN